MKLWHRLRCLIGLHRLRLVRRLGMGCTLFTCKHCHRYLAWNPRAGNGIGVLAEFDCELYRLHRDFGDVGLEVYLKDQHCV